MNSSNLHGLARGFVALLIPLGVMSVTSSPARAELPTPTVCGIRIDTSLFNPNTTSSSSVGCSQVHTASFNGVYYAVASYNNDTRESGACYDAGVHSSPTACRVTFKTPLDFRDACKPHDGTAVTDGFYYPQEADSSKQVDMPLHWVAGGVLEGTFTTPTSPSVTYTMHIQIEDLCDTPTALPGSLQALPGVDTVLSAMIKTYKFTGYVDVR